MSLDMTDSGALTGAPIDLGDADDEAVPDQLVAFMLDDECFAFPMASVLEIIRLPQTMRVPLAPPALRGLANLRGAVLPVVDLRAILGLPALPPGDATRALVVDCGRPVALVVDRVSSVIDMPAGRIERPAEGTLRRSELLSGVVRNAGGRDLVQVLDPVAAVRREFAQTAAAADGRNAGVAAPLAGAPRAVEDDDGDEDAGAAQLVSITVDGQEYGFVIGDVDEIVRVPPRIGMTPEAPGHVLGLMDLRGRLLPIVSLRRMFGLPEAPLSEANRIVVVRDGGSGDGGRIGVVVDHVREVLRVGEGDRVETPPALRAGAERIAWLCRLEDGARLIGVIEAATLFEHPAGREAAAMRPAGETAAGAGDEDGDEMMRDVDPDDDDGDEIQLVVYQIAGQEYGAPIASVQEIIRVPETISRTPNAPAHIVGMINLRGAVLPVAAMRRRFGLEDAPRNDRQRILVLGAGQRRMGFTVDSVSEVLRVPRATVEDAPELSGERRRLVGEVANLDEGKRMILMLDADALLAACHGDAG
jgi:purine-binding chemotaxis protein CheW